MSFRKEEKLHIHKSQLLNLIDWIYKNNGYRLYDTRIVSSTYFDNDQMQMFKDSEEGTVPRKKIRVRSYTKSKHKSKSSTLEIKVSSVEGRYKKKDINFDIKKVFTAGIFDKNYGICKPKVRVTYKRDYYKVHGVRLTIDNNIEYLKLNSNGKGVFKKYDNNAIVEVKAANFVPTEYLYKEFYFDRIRFSKYSNAVKSFID